MARHSVDVVITARDRASRQFKTIGLAAGGMGSMLKKAALAAGVYLGGRQVLRFLKDSVSLYGRQEAAVKGLSDALDLLGAGGRDNVHDMEKFAGSIQKNTRYGDEAILELMAMGSAMGKLSGETLKKSTKAALGLAKAYKIDTVAAMRLVARAAAGDTTTLARYGIKLGEGLSTQEKFNKVLEIGIRNFKLATDEVKTHNVIIEQLKNVWGDTKEFIGKTLIPAIDKWAVKTKQWLEDNQKTIGQWAEKSISYITLAKDAFMSFVDFMKSDWKAGMKFAFDSFLILLEAAFRTAVTMAIAGGKGIWRGVKEGIFNSKGKEATEIALTAHKNRGGTVLTKGQVYGKATDAGGYWASGKERKQWVKQRYAQYGGSYIPVDEMEDFVKLRGAALKTQTKETVSDIIGGTLQTTKQIYIDALKEIEDKMPPELWKDVKAAFDEHKKRLEQIMASDKYGLPTAGEGAPPFIETIKKALAGKSGGGAAGGWNPLEARFLTFAPGTKFDIERATERNTKSMDRNLRELLVETKKLVRNSTTGTSLNHVSVTNFA